MCNGDSTPRRTLAVSYNITQPGQHTLRVRGVDVATNYGPETVHSFSTDACLQSGQCRAANCSTGSGCTCTGGHFLDLRDHRMCRRCAPITGCTDANLYCTSGADSVCGECVPGYDAANNVREETKKRN